MKKFLTAVLLAVFALELSGCEAMQRVIDRQTARELAAAEAKKPKPAPPDPKAEAFWAWINDKTLCAKKDECDFSGPFLSDNAPEKKSYWVYVNNKRVANCVETPAGSGSYVCM